MNRRHFFGMTAAAVAMAGLPSMVLPEKTIFLPPRWGWKPAQLGAGYMREMQQFCIDEDRYWQYAAIGRDIWGAEHQFCVYTKVRAPELAARLIADRFAQDGVIAIPSHEGRKFCLALSPIIPGRYI